MQRHFTKSRPLYSRLSRNGRHSLPIARAGRSVVVLAALAATLALSLSVAALSTPGTANAASWLHYQRGYYVDAGWLCYGWHSGAYHCTHHWHIANGHLVSDNTRWVPNNLPGGASFGRSSRVVHHSAGVVSHSSGSVSFGGSGSVQNMIRSVFGAYAGQALRVASCESGYAPNAYNRSSGASGVFQFLASTWRTTSYAGYSRFNAWANIHAAHQVFVRDGYSWREWSCKPW